MPKLSAETWRWIAYLIFTAGVFYARTQEIIGRLDAQWPVTAQQIWVERFAAHNPQLYIPPVSEALRDANLRNRSDN